MKGEPPMPEQKELLAEKRQVLGKKVRFLRRRGMVPANIYGHGRESMAVQMDAAMVKRMLAKREGAGLINLKVAGEQAPLPSMLRQIQWDPRTGNLLHLDFYAVRMTEKIKVEVPLRLEGESPAAALGGQLIHNLYSVEIECLPADIPSHMAVDISRLEEIGQAIHVSDLPPLPGVTILTAPDLVIARVEAIRVEAAPEVEAPKAVEEAAPQPEDKGEAKEKG